MFTLIRAVIIVGLIFYLSPERGPHGPDRPKVDGERIAASATGPRGSDMREPNSLWNRLVGSFGQEAVRTAVNERAQAIGLGAIDQTLWSGNDSSARAAAAESVRQAMEAAEHNSSGQSVRCVYRCDGTE